MIENNKTKIKSLALVIALSIAGLFISYGSIFSRIHSIYFNSSIDGIKNYYTLQYHVLHDTSYTHFQGMNYPYGEHILYTDNQPVLANTLRFIHHNLFDLSGSVILVMNLLMLVSVVLCAVFLCLILLEFKVNWWYAALAAAGIAFLSPQLTRFSTAGHYALSYSFYIPMLWYLWLRFLDKKSYIKSLLTGLIVFVFSLLHPYYLPIGAFFGLSIWFFAFFQKLIKPKHAAHIFIQLILPLILFQLWIKLTDHVIDRPSSPWGFLPYRAFWEGVFLPYDLPLGRFIHNHLGGMRPLDYENIIYVGMVGTIFMLTLIFTFFKRLLFRQWNNLQPAAFSPALNVSFWAAIVVTLFAFGLPFIAGMEFLIQYLGPLKQFRGIGRFTWIFYYVLNTLAFVSFFRFYKYHKNKALSLSIILLPLVILMYDIYEYHKLFKPGILSSSYSPGKPVITDAAKYQAIIPIPYFHIGAENLGIEIRCESFKIAQEASLASGLPLTAVVMSRSSAGQTLKQLPVHLPEYRPLHVIKDYPSQKPFLLAVAADCELNTEEKNWITKAEFIKKENNTLYYSLPFSALQDFGKNITAKNADSIRNIKNHAAEIYLYKSFNEGNTKGYFQNGIKNIPGENLLLYNAELPEDSSLSYTVSVWIYAGKNPYGLSSLHIDEYNGINVQTGKSHFIATNIIKQLDGEWALLEKTFTIQNPGNRIHIYLKNESLTKDYLFADELLIRPANQNVLLDLHGGGLYLNNLFFPGR